MFKKIDKYFFKFSILGVCLGKGGFAKVFLSFSEFPWAYKKQRSQPVAIKLIPMKRVERQDQAWAEKCNFSE